LLVFPNGGGNCNWDGYGRVGHFGHFFMFNSFDDSIYWID
jgi:hypothetical protein